MADSASAARQIDDEPVCAEWVAPISMPVGQGGETDPEHQGVEPVSLNAAIFYAAKRLSFALPRG